MALITSILMKYGQTIGAMAMAALLRYLEKTSLIQKYKKQIDDAVQVGKDSIEQVNNSNNTK